MAAVKFYTGTLAQYNALQSKDANTLYYVVDEATNKAYQFKGDVPYVYPIEVVSEFPSSGQRQGVIYVNTSTKQSQYWDGSAWQSLSLEVITTIPDSGALDTNIPSTKAVADYVAKKIAESTAGVGAVSFSNDTHKLSVTADGSLTETAIAGLVLDFAYASTTGVVTLSYTDNTGASTSKTINLPLEQVLTGVEQHTVTAEEAGTGIYEGAVENDIGLLMTVTNQSNSTSVQYFVNLKNFIDVYTSGSAATDTVKIVVGSEDNTIKATIALGSEFSANATNGNLEVSAIEMSKITGLTNALAGKIATITGGTVGNLVTVAADGQVADSGKAIGGATLNATPNANTIATEAAVKAYADSAINTALTWQTIA